MRGKFNTLQRRCRKKVITLLTAVLPFEKFVRYISGLFLPFAIGIILIIAFDEQNPFDDFSQILANSFAPEKSATQKTNLPITILEIDNRDTLNSSSDWQYRWYLACIADAAVKQGAKVVGLDFNFDKRIKAKNAAEQNIIRKTRYLLNNNRIILASQPRIPIGSTIGFETNPDPQIVDPKSYRWGLSSYEVLDSQRARTATIMKRVWTNRKLDTIAPSFSFVLQKQGEDKLSRRDMLQTDEQCLGSGCSKKLIEKISKHSGLSVNMIDESGGFRLRYKKIDEVFTSISLSAQTELSEEVGCKKGIFSHQRFDNKYVLIGETFPKGKDVLKNPLSYDFNPLPFKFNGLLGSETWPGVYYQAYALWNQLNSFPLDKTVVWAQYLTTICSCTIFLLLFWLLRFRKTINKVEQSLNDSGYIAFWAIGIPVFFVSILSIIAIDGLLIAYIEKTILASVCLLWFSAFVSLLALLDRTMHTLISKTHTDGFHRHLLKPDSIASLELLHNRVGEKLNAYVFHFEFSIDIAAPPSEIECLLSEGVQYLKSQFREFANIHFQSEPLLTIDNVYVSNVTRNKISLIWIIDDLEEVNHEYISENMRKLKENILLESTFAKFFKSLHLKNGPIVILNMYENLEEGVLTFSGPAMDYE